MTRQELYDLVWSAPMRAVAEQLGISDKSVAKRCQTHGVPSPPRGYWTQAAANRVGVRPPLEGDGRKLIPTTKDVAAGRNTKSRPAPTDLVSLPGIPVSVETPRSDDGRGPALDLPLVRVLAAELHAQDTIRGLLDRVASQALMLPADQAKPTLRWVAEIRSAIEKADPVAVGMRANRM